MTTARIRRFDGDTATETDDSLTEEEPLEIRIGDRAVSVTLRTPGDDFDLVLGFLLSESILKSADDVAAIRHWGSPNVVRVDLGEGVRVDLQRLERHFYSTSSCGVCGKTSIDALRVEVAPLTSEVRVRRETIAALPDALRAGQATFELTGGIHAAAVFAADGTLVRLREDVGRHNAVDKVIGSLAAERIDVTDRVLMVSGRVSFEIVQKAVVAGIPILAAVGAPSTLAVELAESMNLTLLGFVRDGRFNAYSALQRIE